MFLKSREEFELLRCQNFLKVFLPWVLPAALGFGPGLRGQTPLHWAAFQGHVSILERLIEAKAAVDVKENYGRGLGRRIWGWKTLLRKWDFYVRKWMECWWFKLFPTPWVAVFSSFMDSLPKHLQQHLVFFVASMFCLHWRFYFGSILERPLQSKMDHTFPAQFNGP